MIECHSFIEGDLSLIHDISKFILAAKVNRLKRCILCLLEISLHGNMYLHCQIGTVRSFLQVEFFFYLKLLNCIFILKYTHLHLSVFVFFIIVFICRTV